MQKPRLHAIETDILAKLNVICRMLNIISLIPNACQFILPLIFIILRIFCGKKINKCQAHKQQDNCNIQGRYNTGINTESHTIDNHQHCRICHEHKPRKVSTVH